MRHPASRIATVVLLAPLVAHVSVSVASAQTGAPRNGKADLIARYEAIRHTKRIKALRISEPIVVDGRFDEPAWEQAEVGTDFYQQQPDEGSLTTMPSEIRFLYDASNLYVGGTFFDDDPIDGPITNELKRDFSARDGDLITVVFDTFGDRRTSFNFMTNPAGAMRDSQAYDDGRQNNQNWDGIWFIKTARFEKGWTMEMAIPFKTLRFPHRGVQEWNMNVFRLIRRMNEITLWSPVPRQFNQFKVSWSGVLDGLTDIRPGHNLRIKPYATSQGQLNKPGRPAGWDAGGNMGVDVKYGIASALTLDGTYRTDFSQVEADEQQINLTRSSLYYPEKREFFLENQGAFRAGDQDTSSERRDLLPFFSRRIGLSEDREVPIIGGVRLTGKEGAYGIGAMTMWTESAGSLPAQAFTAIRMTREISGRPGSAIGGFYFGRQSNQDANHAGGADVHLNFARTRDLDLFVVKTSAPGQTGRDWAARLAFVVTENKYTSSAAYTNVGDGYRNDLGFVARRDIGLFSVRHGQNFRPKTTYRWVRTHTFGIEADVYEDSHHRQLLTRVIKPYYANEWADGGTLRVDFAHNHEVLTERFQIFPGYWIRPGEYTFKQFVPNYTSDKSRWLSGNFKLTTGEFWSGTILGVDAGLRVRVNEHLAASTTVSRSDVTLDDGEFTTQLVGFRVDYSFSTRMFLNAFVQYNREVKGWLTNVRFDLIHRPLSDLFVVFNDTRTSVGLPTRAVIVKYTHAISF